MDENFDTAALKTIDPDSMTRFYLKIGVVSALVIIIMTCYGTYRVYLTHIVAEAERSAVALANSLMDSQKNHLVLKTPAGTEELKVLSSEESVLNRELGIFFKNFSILKIKIFDHDTRILYSNDSSIVGKSDPGNPRLKNALLGKNDSKVVKKDKILDFEGNEKFSVDVVETYIPVRDSSGKIIGSFELYQDVTHYKRAIVKLVTISGLILLLILLWVYSISFVFLRKEAVKVKQIQEILKIQATTDFLTGVCNRRQILNRCTEEISRYRRMRTNQRLERCIGFVMVDIDHFKSINDRYGHECGDGVICEVARRLKESIRKHDIVGRYGGEEFLVILPNANDEHLRIISDRLWQSVRSTPFKYNEEELSVTISLGVSATTGGDENQEDIIRRADDALYRSKNAGRDRITFA